MLHFYSPSHCANDQLFVYAIVSTFKYLLENLMGKGFHSSKGLINHTGFVLIFITFVTYSVFLVLFLVLIDDRVEIYHSVGVYQIESTLMRAFCFSA
jgi:hypothetical protein